MKVVDVCAFYAPEGGGVRTYVDRKLAALPAQGHEITVIAPGRHDRVEPRGPGARILWKASPAFPLDRRYRYFADEAELHATIDRERPDVLEASSPWRSASMVAAWRGPAIRSLVLHADPLAAYAYRWFGAVADRATIDRRFDWYWRHLRRLDAGFDIVVSPNRGLSSRLVTGGLRSVVTVPMGIEGGIFSPALRDPILRRSLLEECRLDEDATLLLGVGRHAPEKRWGMIARAVTMAGARAPVGLIIIGDGRASHRCVAAAAGNPHIRLASPLRDRRALARIMASADAMIHGCEAETFCFAAAEAVASGLPLIVPDQGGAADHGSRSCDMTFSAANVSEAALAITAFAERLRIPVPPPAQRTMDTHFADLLALYCNQRLRRAA